MTFQYFSPYRSFGGNIDVKVDLSNYATKADLKDAAVIDTSHFTLKPNLASVKTEVDKIDVDNLKTVPVDLGKLSNVVKNVKKTAYDKLVTKVNNIYTTGFVAKTKYDTEESDLETKISDAEKEILDISRLVIKQIIILKSLK